jgi:hypothetical protein
MKPKDATEDKMTTTHRATSDDGTTESESVVGLGAAPLAAERPMAWRVWSDSDLTWGPRYIEREDGGAEEAERHAAELRALTAKTAYVTPLYTRAAPAPPEAAAPHREAVKWAVDLLSEFGGVLANPNSLAWLNELRASVGMPALSPPNNENRPETPWT